MAPQLKPAIESITEALRRSLNQARALDLQITAKGDY
jgi:hypothetical protein